MCLTVHINVYTSQVPGDFLGELQNSLLLTEVPISHASMSMTHHNTDTHQYGNSDRTF